MTSFFRSAGIMSHLDAFQFHFSGDVISDPSTVNNHEIPLHQ